MTTYGLNLDRTVVPDVANLMTLERLEIRCSRVSPGRGRRSLQHCWRAGRMVLEVPEQPVRLERTAAKQHEDGQEGLATVRTIRPEQKFAHQSDLDQLGSRQVPVSLSHHDDPASNQT